MTLRLLTLACAAALAGCASIDDLPPVSAVDHSPFVPVAPEAPRAATGSIYRPVVGETLLGRVRRFQAGDVLTVILNEQTQAARAATANVTRAANNDVVPAGLVGKVAGLGGALTGLNLNTATLNSKGEGTADQSNSLTGAITVTVMEVQANGNLVVRGEKRMALTQGSELIQVSGVVRPDDVAPNNTVQSRRLADARFAYQGGGELASATRAGWGTRSLLKVWPF
ncbi:flagellar basal body L-ring protein FlgH [Ramlibacter sp. MAHUQ-53]|uniref:flagellar basal body L-ring protein FlgH n=1 Tax=unclassified Ramlibacter TaxID=2617605 RepID=UPI003639EC63